MAALLSISIAPSYGAPLVRVDQAEVIDGHGLVGDRYAGSARQVTIVCTGEVEEASGRHGTALDPFETRRNLVVDLPDLPRAQGTRISIGETVLEVWRDCAPCEVMDEVFGTGAGKLFGNAPACLLRS